MMANIWSAISEAISSFTSAMVTGVKAFVELFYDNVNSGFTILGYFALCGIAIGIVWSLIRLVRRLMRVN